MEVYEVPDSPPPPPPSEVVKEVSPAPSSASSTTSDLTAIQYTCRLQEGSAHSHTGTTLLTDPPIPSYTSSQPLSLTHKLVPNDPISQGHTHPRLANDTRTEGVAKTDSDCEEEEDCLITEPTTSRYFRNQQSSSSVRESSGPTVSEGHTDSLSADEEELLRFRKTSSEFNRTTLSLSQIGSRSPSLSLPRQLPQRSSLVQAIEDFNNRPHRGQGSDEGSDSSRGNVAASSNTLLAPPTLTDPELDEEGDCEGVRGGSGEGVRCEGVRGGSGEGVRCEGVRGGPGEGVRCEGVRGGPGEGVGVRGNTRWAGRRERSIFDFIEGPTHENTSNHPNSSSFYGAGIYHYTYSV